MSWLIFGWVSGTLLSLGVRAAGKLIQVFVERVGVVYRMARMLIVMRLGLARGVFARDGKEAIRRDFYFQINS